MKPSLFRILLIAVLALSTAGILALISTSSAKSSIKANEFYRTKDLTDGLVKVIDEQYRRGILKYEEYLAVKDNVMQNGIQIASIKLPGLSPLKEFGQGILEGMKNIRDTMSAGLNNVVHTFTSIVPWQTSVLIGIAIVIYLAPTFTGRKSDDDDDDDTVSEPGA